jgi:ELWxxDGT repeat protein
MKYLMICLALCAGPLCSAQSSLELLKDINTAPKRSGNSVIRIAGKGDRIFFSADGLWKSDGSKDGTGPVYDVINTDIPLEPAKLQVTDQLVFFQGHSGEDHAELWRSDGTQAGTFKVKDICPGECGIDVLSTLVVGNTLYFIEKDWSGNVALWKTDGTEAGTVLLENQITTNSSENIMKPELMASLDGNILYIAEYNLWRTDGMPGSAVVFHEGALACKPVVFKGELYYTASDPNHSFPVFRTDGVTKSLVKDSDGHVVPGYDNHLFTHNSETLYLMNENAFWVSDGTDAGTRYVTLPPDISAVESAATNDKLYFTAQSDADGLELYSSDGTQGGTGMHYESEPGSYSLEPVSLTGVGGMLFFQLDKFLYVVKNNTVINLAGELYEPETLTNIGGMLYFSAWHFKDGQFVAGKELWKSDGTPAGTIRITGPTGTDSTYPYMVLSRDGNAVFRTDYYGAEQNHISQLWRTDGTQAGTAVIAEDVRFVFPMTVGPEQSLIYQSWDNWLYRTDGDFLNPVAVSSKTISGSLSESIKMGDKIFFTASQNASRQIWFTDGTEAGTDFIDLTARGIKFELILNLTVHEGELYFSADDGVNGEELWKTDGTPEGTLMVADINPGPQASQPRNLVSLGDKLLFKAYAPGVGFELFSTNGTEAGTLMLADLDPGVGSGSPLPMKVMNDVLYFSAMVQEIGFCLWRTDGTIAGTSILKDIHIYADPWGRNSIVLGNTLFFVADTEEFGQEVWKTDGTAEGTQLVEDLVPGQFSSFPDYFIKIGEAVYFLAKSPDDGYEIWKIDESHCGALKVTENADVRLTQVIGAAGDHLLVVAENSEVGQELSTYHVVNDGEGKLEQTLSENIPDPVTYGQSLDDLVVSTSGLPLTYSTNDSQVAEINAATVEFIGVGEVTLTASQPGNNEFCFTSITIVLDVGKAGQEITFDPFSGTTAAEETISLTGSASSGLPVSYASGDEAVASIDGSTILVHATGSAEITASQAGNEHFLAAEDVMRLLTISPVTGVRAPASEGAVYPVPTDGLLFVRTNGGSASITVSDIGAKALVVTSVTSGENQLDLRHLPPGIYMISIRSNGIITHQRIIKK